MLDYLLFLTPFLRIMFLINKVYATSLVSGKGEAWDGSDQCGG